MKKIVCLILCSISFILLVSCPSPVSSSNDTTASDASATTVQEVSDYFVEDTDSGETVLSLNSEDLLTSSGSTYWATVASGESFSTIEVSLRKTSGSNVGGFGVIFALEGSGNDLSALVVMINILGEYCVGLVEENSFDYICEWTDADCIKGGYSQYNTLRIEEYDSAGRYKLYINNTETEDFEDPGTEVHDGGTYGYLAVVTPIENFPSVPVTVYFEE